MLIALSDLATQSPLPLADVAIPVDDLCEARISAELEKCFTAKRATALHVRIAQAIRELMQAGTHSPTQEQIAAKSQCCRRTVVNALKTFYDCKAMARVRQYRLNAEGKRIFDANSYRFFEIVGPLSKIVRKVSSAFLVQRESESFAGPVNKVNKAKKDEDWSIFRDNPALKAIREMRDRWLAAAWAAKRSRAPP